MECRREADSAFHEELMVAVGKTVGLVPDPLEKTQRARILRQQERERAGGPVDFLEFFCKRNAGCGKR